MGYTYFMIAPIKKIKKSVRTAAKFQQDIQDWTTEQFHPKLDIENPDDIRFIVVDLFCGAGGTTIGFDQARNKFGKRVAIIAACINHDHNAIVSHWQNHPEVYHYQEDITTMYGMVKHKVYFMSHEILRLRRLIEIYRAIYPNAKVILWASLECTNFSKAKGGQPRDQDSRTLANHLDRYIYAIDPDYIQIENVVEFMSWGPMRVVCKKQHKENKKRGKWKVYANSELKYIFNKKTQKSELAFTPISKKNGQDFRKWESHTSSLGYKVEWREMNSADFGAYTSRNRLFGCFAKSGLPIVWPKATHSKNATGELNLFGEGLRKWNAVKDLLDFSDEGESIFNRKKAIVDNSLNRIYAGLVKEILSQKNNSFSLANTAFLTAHYGNDKGSHSILNPCNTLSTKDRFKVIQYTWLDKQYSGAANHQSTNTPAGTLLVNDKHALMTAKGFIFNPSFNGHSMHIDQPCPVIVARQDKSPLYFIQYNLDPNVRIEVYPDDSEIMIKIKKFMALYGISDIKMRMLKIMELKLIQGFPADYKLFGNQSDQKKFIGNSVVPLVVKCWAEAQNDKIIEYEKIAA